MLLNGLTYAWLVDKFIVTILLSENSLRSERTDTYILQFNSLSIIKCESLCSLVYNFTKLFLKEEIYNLKSQQQRSLIFNFSANIAEGFGEKGKADKYVI